MIITNYIREQVLTSKVLVWILKISVLLMFVGLIYYQLVQKNDLTQLYNQLVYQLSISSIWLFAIVMVLMPINWFLESEKWRTLLGLNLSIARLKSFKAILCGLTIGIITPQRAGEYGGRAMIIGTQHAWTSVIATLYSSISQNISNVLLGLIGMLIFANLYLDISNYLMYSCLALIGLGILALSFIYFNLNWVKEKIGSKAMDWVYRKLKISKTQGFDVDDKTLIIALGLSASRYVVYISQYVLLLIFFGVDAELIALITGVSTIFLLQSTIPLPPLFGVLARGEIALLVWSVFDANELSILSATFALWVINLFIPAMIGMFYLMRAKVIQDEPN